LQNLESTERQVHCPNGSCEQSIIKILAGTFDYLGGDISLLKTTAFLPRRDFFHNFSLFIFCEQEHSVVRTLG
jgi:hypothetical protein